MCGIQKLLIVSEYNSGLVFSLTVLAVDFCIDSLELSFPEDLCSLMLIPWNPYRIPHIYLRDMFIFIEFM